jgi:hypothetical protein
VAQSFGTACEAAKIGAEAETLDADLKRSAAAVQEMLEEGFEAQRALKIFIDLSDLPMGQFFPARADGEIVAEAVEEELDLAEIEVHLAGEADEEHAIEGVTGITALAADALRDSEEAHSFVVADRGGVEAGLAGEFSDFHFNLPFLSGES